MVLDVAEKESEHCVKDGREKVVIILHGVTGSTMDYYVLLMVDKLVKNGFNVVALNHVGVKGLHDVRLMNFCKQKYLDEVIRYSTERFSKEVDGSNCDVFLFGYSLGGNHCLRYQGAASKNQKVGRAEPNDCSGMVKGIVSVSNPFDVLSTSVKLQQTYFGLLDIYLSYKLYSFFKSYNFKD